MPIPIVCQRCGMQIWYYEWANNDAAEEIFLIPEPYRPNRTELEDDPSFCPHCGEPKRRSVVKQYQIKTLSELNSVETIWETRAVLEERRQTFCVFLDLMRRRADQVDGLSDTMKAILAKEYQTIISQEKNSAWFEEAIFQKFGVKP